MNNKAIVMLVLGVLAHGAANAGDGRRWGGYEEYEARSVVNQPERCDSWRRDSWHEEGEHYRYRKTYRDYYVQQQVTQVVQPVVVYREVQAPPVREVVYRDVYVPAPSAPVYSNVESRGGSGAIIGAVAGGLIGSNVGKGNGRVAASALGAALGAVVGDRIQNRSY
ncbi:MAG: hypothetical protein RIR70_1749 [Pseudomonadota bacterium]